MEQLLEQFLQEARENLAFIDQNIESIGGDDPELLNSVFRAAHTLKGGSGIVGFDSIRDITHSAEDLLDMLRAGKLPFQNSMIDALYNAFDEVMNLVEAAEESGEIVSADEETVARIVENLNAQMGKSSNEKVEWSVPFVISNSVEDIVNIPLSMLGGITKNKIKFNMAEIDEEFCLSENFYAIVFDIDESCMVYGNDPIYALSLLEDRVLGVYSCMRHDSAKSVLSGTEDADGLLLKTQIVAFVYATYTEIEDSLFNFIDELNFLPLDVSLLLSVNMGDSGHSLDLLKELSSLTDSSDMSTIVFRVEQSIGLVGANTLQYSQLRRFLDISGLIDERDVPKLKSFFQNLYRGAVYHYDETNSVEEPLQNSHKSEAAVKVEVDDSMRVVMDGILAQQKEAINCVHNDDDLKRVINLLDLMREFMPDMPSGFNSKEEIVSFIDSKLGLVSQSPLPEEIKPHEEVQLQESKLPDEMPKTVVVEPKKEEITVHSSKPDAQIRKEEFKEESKEETKKAVVGKTVKIDQESIDSLMNVVGELLVAKNSLPYLADNVVGLTHEMIKREIMEKYIFINRLSEQLQDLIMSMRMLPISYVFDRYPKLVRDISSKLGKKVRLEMDGGETKLDKNMIEMLADPMIHVMRNSLDHGIESPDIREQKGKNPSGLIKLNAYAQSDKIIIEIIDDGAGINIDRVVNKVLEKGLLSIEQIDAMSDSQKAELVLLPGLSTAESISEYSGRGVGMDVVKKSIESFGGNISIKTKANHGTTITLAIPVSLAVTSLLHIQMNDIHYGIPMDSVSETVKIEKSEIEYLHNEPFIYLRGEVIPLLFIHSMLNSELIDKEPLSIVVLNIKDNLLAVVVNKFIGQLDVVQKPLVGIMENHPIFSGTALLGNGQIIMAIDPLGLLGISQKIKDVAKAA